ncbi:MAG: hypothetical protein MUF64_30735 [Polyangiaceae bacterium]|nr:hypothetical protein [Polyangiaceae bacterium]
MHQLTKLRFGSGDPGVSSPGVIFRVLLAIRAGRENTDQPGARVTVDKELVAPEINGYSAEFLHTEDQGDRAVLAAPLGKRGGEGSKGVEHLDLKRSLGVPTPGSAFFFPVLPRFPGGFCLEDRLDLLPLFPLTSLVHRTESHEDRRDEDPDFVGTYLHFAPPGEGLGPPGGRVVGGTTRR